MTDHTTDGRPNYCLHAPHPDPAIEAAARAIYMSRYGAQGGWWELNETPQVWWQMAEKGNRMDQRRLKRLALDGIFWSAAHDNVGIYPKSITGGPGAYEKRSERMEGWNDAVTEHTDNYCAVSRWHAAVPDAFRELVTELLLDERIDLAVRGKECELHVNCSDTFYWGCSDVEEITFAELSDLKECWSLSESGGDLWCARKRGMRPQAACYRKIYPRSEWPLFDACGPVRTDPDGCGYRGPNDEET